MYLVQVIEKIKQSSHLSLLESSEIMQIIEELLKACPLWIKKVDVNGNFILRINKKMNTCDVLEGLKEYQEKSL